MDPIGENESPPREDFKKKSDLSKSLFFAEIVYTSLAVSLLDFVNTTYMRASSPATNPVARGREAYEALSTLIDSLAPRGLELPRVDIQLAAAFARRVGERDLAAPRVDRFRALSRANLWSFDHLDRLPQWALATWYCHRQYLKTRGANGLRTLSEETNEAAKAVRARMLRVLEYHLGAAAKYQRVLSELRSRGGYQDLTNDLETLVDLYTHPEVKAVLEQDTRWYRPEDVEEAVRLADEVFDALGVRGRNEVVRWQSQARACWTELNRTYEEVARAGRFLFYETEEVAVTYPSLVAVIRAPRRRSSAEPGPSADTGPPAANEETPEGEEAESSEVTSSPPAADAR